MPNYDEVEEIQEYDSEYWEIVESYSQLVEQE